MHPRLLVGAVTFAVASMDLSVLGAPAAGSALLWEQSFPVNDTPTDVHFQAHYEATGGSHRVETWRHGDAFLRRETDGALDLYVTAKAPPEYEYRYVDHRRRVVIDVDRTSLYRIGVFSDWFGLAHVLDRPKATHQVFASRPLADENRKDCEWRVLVRKSGEATDRRRVCWSRAWGLPMVIRHALVGSPGRYEDEFSIDSVDARPLPEAERALPPIPSGYAAFDGAKEISGQD